MLYLVSCTDSGDLTFRERKNSVRKDFLKRMCRGVRTGNVFGSTQNDPKKIYTEFYSSLFSGTYGQENNLKVTLKDLYFIMKVKHIEILTHPYLQ